MAELSISGASTQGEPSVQDEDGDFEPSADMLVHDFDDEQTLEEEEMLQGETNFSSEIDDLTREGEMPIHELLKMYGYGGADSADEDDGGAEEQRVLESQQGTTPLGRDEASENGGRKGATATDGPVDHSPSSSDDSACRRGALSTARLIGPEPGSYFDGNDAGESEDEDYIPCEEWKKEVMVGPMYQAETPSGLCRYKDDEKAYENDDQLLWDPELLPEKEVVEFLAEASKRSEEEPGVKTVPEKPLIKDNEQALYELVKCNFNREEALKKIKFDVKPAKEELPLWSEEEGQIFEQANDDYGNDLKYVQANKQMKLWRRKPSLPYCGTEPADCLLDEPERRVLSQAVAPPAGCDNFRSTMHSCEDSQATGQLLVCVSDHPSDSSHTNGSSHVPDLTTADAPFHPDASSLLGKTASRREDEEGSERPLKRPKTEQGLHPTASTDATEAGTV